ncbi:MAG: 1-deoxy-D-xylulose-5-phosphate reductoisomerase [Chloroflexi bacterium]|nr:1-deoxy-D-xylulose-5-phosphate reductoisomerase [Chloroflexota bacterium]
MGYITNVAILGSTGSIGQQTLDVIRSFPGRFKVIAITAGANADLLIRQVEEFKPQFVFIQSGDLNLAGTTHISPEEIVSYPEVDLVVVATSGKAGLQPTLAAIKAGKKIALANKEVLVIAGDIIMSEAKKHNVEIRPIDSEHSAIWQCLQGEDKGKIKQIILTASGGPFRKMSTDSLAGVTAADALKHPTWKMGRKVTIDSATLMNKGFEVIEAHWLFDVSLDNIKVVIHPESIIHSMVEFTDGSVKAQLGCPDMRLPIQYALLYPERGTNPNLPRLDFDTLRSLNFEDVDNERFPCLSLAIETAKKGGTYPAVLSAVDEMAVHIFLAKRIRFPDIPKLLKTVLDQHKPVANPGLEDILAADMWARELLMKAMLS